jgi:hypothetical protein
LDVETAEQSDPSFTVIVPRYGIEGRVSIPIEADDPKIERFPEDHKLTYENGDESVSIQVFDKVRVSIWVRNVQDHQRELVIELVKPNFASERLKRSLETSDMTESAKKRNKRNSK